ncbi:NAD(P)/FAD-dependent oxidoreductase [Nostocoides veronense]|uniref:flavin-containing monooxygenase n=1 Tax=Nostocoides veronense TaxID=330836 RepID=UPI0031DD6D04
MRVAVADDNVNASVLIIGAGPAGLGTAGALAQRGIRSIILERAADVAASWRGHYDRLHLHTTRTLSGLPGLEIPAAYGRWVARDDLVRYLEGYRDHFGLDVRTGVEVVGVERASAAVSSPWVVRSAKGEEWHARHVVIATGYNHTPVLPSWPGQEDFPGEVIHAASYRNPRPYAGRSVLVVGTGNTGCEIAQDLAEAGVGPVWLAVRTPPHILRRDTMGMPAQWTGIAVRHLPAAVVDRVAAVIERTSIPDLRAYGVPRAKADLLTRVRVGSIPVQDVGIVAAIRSRRVTPVPAVQRIEGAVVHLVDGSVVEPDAIIMAAGYTRGLDGILAGLGVLGADGRPIVHGARNPSGATGLWFNGYTNPISGMLREISRDATAIAAAIARG